MTNLLVTRPEHDDTTHYLSNWVKETFKVVEFKNIKIIDLNRERANKNEVESILKKQNPEIIIFNGHGNTDRICGHRNEPIIVAEKNDSLLKNKLIYAISCSSAKELGPKSVKSGAKAFIGYDDDFHFVYEINKLSNPLQDETASLFLEPSNELIISILKGNTIKESCTRSKDYFKRNIRKLLTSCSDQESLGTARLLWWDMKCQIYIGDENFTISL